MKKMMMFKQGDMTMTHAELKEVLMQVKEIAKYDVELAFDILSTVETGN